jgi:hypothetical protein
LLGFMRVLRVFGENRKFTIRVCYRVWYMLLVLVLLLYIYNIKGRANKSFFIFWRKLITKDYPRRFTCVFYVISQKHVYVKSAKQHFAIEIFNIVIEMFNSQVTI